MGPDVVPQAIDSYHLGLDGHYLFLSHEHYSPNGASGCMLPYRLDLTDPDSLSDAHLETLLAQVYQGFGDNGQLIVNGAQPI